MSANYTKLTGENYVDQSFIVDGWAVEVSEPYFLGVWKNGKTEYEYHPERNKYGFVFDRLANDCCGYVGDCRWVNASNMYLWKTEAEAIAGYQRYFESHRKFWEKFGIKSEDVFKRVCHIVHKNEIKIVN